ncbi:MAG TPA: hypothetical protein DEO38_00815, partial [Bacteroidales bacterium]|nr:hypothetical protein [Bacteroidales bacterium]
MSTFAANITAGTKLYLAPGMWDDGSARFAAYFYNGSGNAWADLSALSGTDYYVVEAPSGTWTNVIFCRMNGGTTANDWGNKWNQSGDLVYDGTNNLFTISSWDNQTSGWSTYTAAGGSTSEPVTEPEGGVTYTVTVPSGTNQCYINGEATGNTFVKMTLLADGRYQKRITTAHTGLTYNYYSGASADYVEVTALGNAVSPRA